MRTEMVIIRMPSAPRGREMGAGLGRIRVLVHTSRVGDVLVLRVAMAL